MSTVTPLPTRVNRACDRCRRNKSRCDSYRPCSLCLRASATCRNTDERGGSPRQSAVKSTTQRRAAERTGKRRRLDSTSNADDSSRVVSRHQHQEASELAERTSPSPDGHQSFRDGGAESAISIARKVRIALIEALNMKTTGTSEDSRHSLEVLEVTLEVVVALAFAGRPSISTAARATERDTPRPMIHTLERRSTYAIPGADTSPALHSATGEIESNDWASTSLYLSNPLPDEATLDILISEYFHSVHWFSLVILESQIQPSWHNVRRGLASPGDRCFLLLLSTMLGLAAWYRAQRCNASDEVSRRAWLELSQRMIANSESQLVYILDQRSLVALQTVILLGSYYVYHGRPNLSFSLLGAAVKCAQSLGLHQKSSEGSWADREEKKRVWWTIYTWDRFASINYGRPLGINEKGYSVEMPEDVPECPGAMLSSRRESQEQIYFSPYQRELNKLYQIASPAIESIYATTGDHYRKAKEYYALVIDVTERLWRWRRELPSHLQLKLDVDWPIHLSAADRAYKLQSLSLYLTFDSLLLILHRPFMKQRLDSVLVGSPDQAFQRQSNSRSGASAMGPEPRDRNGRSADETSTREHLWDAAVRTARIAELPQLAQHATDGHLAVFVALNLFNASVILVVMALSNPLSDRAQEAKRAVARIYRVLMALGDRSTLSQQTSGVLRSLIQLLITRESDAIFLPGAEDLMGGAEQTQPSVRDALSQPLWMPRGDQNGGGSVESHLQQSSAPGLQQGLESVQRAFDTSGFDFDPHAPGRSSRTSISNDPAQRPQGSVEQSYQQEPLDQNRTFFDWRDVNDNGMHWIWDPAWDNMFSSLSQ